MRKALLIGLIGFCLVIGGCAETHVYSATSEQDAAQRGIYGPQRAKGIKFYPVARPVVLVKKADAKGRPIEVETVYIPDTRKPQYLVTRPGIGELDVTLTCENGVAKKFDQSAQNSQVPEMIEAIGNAGVAYIFAKGAIEEIDLIK